MTGDESRLEKRTKQVAEIHRLLGKYLVEYQQCLHWLRAHLAMYLASKPTEQNRMAILLHELPDRALVQCFENLIHDSRKLDDLETEIVSDICNRLKRMIDTRNSLLHSTLFVGWGNETTEDWGTVNKQKGKNKKGKYEFASEDIDEAWIRREIMSVMDLNVHCQRLAIAWNYRDQSQMNIKSNFVRGDDGHFECPHFKPPYHDL